MIIKFLIESGVTIAEIYGEVKTDDKQKALDDIGEKAKALFLTLHPEMRPDIKS